MTDKQGMRRCHSATTVQRAVVRAALVSCRIVLLSYNSLH